MSQLLVVVIYKFYFFQLILRGRGSTTRTRPNWGQFSTSKMSIWATTWRVSPWRRLPVPWRRSWGGSWRRRNPDASTRSWPPITGEWKELFKFRWILWSGAPSQRFPTCDQCKLILGGDSVTFGVVRQIDVVIIWSAWNKCNLGAIRVDVIVRLQSLLL